MIAQGLDSQGIFCDWVSIYQAHDSALPCLNDGAFVRFDSAGDHESTTLRKLKIEGSHETGVFVRCDGHTVWFEGNVSKFCRYDNVFGYDFDQCLERINALLSTQGLPPFTPGRRFEVVTPQGYRPAWTGARITRLDLTQNFIAGSKEDAFHFMRYLGTQQASRLKTGVYGEGETVDFGRGSRQVYSKAYLKGPELLKHSRKALKHAKGCGLPGLTTQREHHPYLEKLAAWCDSVGLVRFETTYKSTFLIDHNQHFLGGLSMTRLISDFAERKAVFTRAQYDVEDLSSLKPKLLAVYRMWQAGDDLTSTFSKPTFYRHRAALLPFGVDIAIKSNVLKFQPRIRLITLGLASPPDFYERPSPSFLALAA